MKTHSAVSLNKQRSTYYMHISLLLLIPFTIQKIYNFGIPIFLQIQSRRLHGKQSEVCIFTESSQLQEALTILKTMIGE